MGQIRNRHKDGWIELDKRAKPQRWVARWYTNESFLDPQGRTRYRTGRHLLGFKTQKDLPTLSAAKVKWEGLRDQLLHNHRPKVRDPDITFRRFCEEEFIPLRKSGWNEATKSKMEYYFGYAYDDLAEIRLVDVTSIDLKRCLDRLAREYSHDTVNGVYTLLRSILKEAVEQHYIEISESPVRGLKMPITRERERAVLSVEETRKLENALEGVDRIIFRLFSRCGLRAGEGFGCQWQDLLPNQTLAIQRACSRGVVKPPKTKKSRKPIYLPTSLYRELLALRQISPDPSPTG